MLSDPTTSREVERDVEAVRLQLDYPAPDNHTTYREALEALDRLARLAHKALKP